MWHKGWIRVKGVGSIDKEDDSVEKEDGSMSRFASFL